MDVIDFVACVITHIHNDEALLPVLSFLRMIEYVHSKVSFFLSIYGYFFYFIFYFTEL